MCTNSNCKCGGVCSTACTCDDNKRKDEYYNYVERCQDQGIVPNAYDVWVFTEYGE